MTVYKRRLISTFVIALFLLISISLTGISAQEKPMGEEAVQAILQIYDYDKTLPLDARVVWEGEMWVEEFEKLGYPVKSREKIVFNGGYGDRVTGYLALPQTGTPPYPCVLQMHGYDNRKDAWWEDESYEYGGLVSRELLSAGFAVLALDMQYHGDRKANLDFESPEVLLGNELWDKFLTMVIESVIDYRRAIDYLETRPEIDKERIGVIGYSLGGDMAYDLTAAEPRIKVMVDCVGVPFKPDSWPTSLAPCAPYHLASAIDKAPVLCLRAKSDEYCALKDAEELYDMIKSPTKDIMYFESTHRIPKEYAPKAAEWFKKHLMYYHKKTTSKMD